MIAFSGAWREKCYSSTRGESKRASPEMIEFSKHHFPRPKCIKMGMVWREDFRIIKVICKVTRVLRLERANVISEELLEMPMSF